MRDRDSGLASVAKNTICKHSLVNLNTDPKQETLQSLQFRGHIPALDGLRGIAVLMVLLAHFYTTAEPAFNDHYLALGVFFSKCVHVNGYGVQLFFVLSGFLISGILLDSRQNGNYFRAFYMRRFLRIFPLYYAALVIVIFVLPNLVSDPSSFQGVLSNQVWLWTYLGNAPWVETSWASPGPVRLGHFWTLCVEEHFYLVWPFAVYFCSSRKLVGICTAVLGMGLTFRALSSFPGSPTWLAWSSLTRLDGLIIGSLIAIGFRHPPAVRFSWMPSSKAILPMGLLFAAIVMTPRRFHYAWWWSFAEIAVAIFFGLVLLQALSRKSHFARLLSNQTLRSFGKYSYGIYLIHYICEPMFEEYYYHQRLLSCFGSPIFGQVIFYILTISSSYALAFASWHLVEKHFLRLKSHFEYRSATSET